MSIPKVAVGEDDDVGDGSLLSYTSELRRRSVNLAINGRHNSRSLIFRRSQRRKKRGEDAGDRGRGRELRRRLRLLVTDLAKYSVTTLAATSMVRVTATR
ncbi:hypothetical protein TIFTF001_008246 [Ficus carica]|uniref:Uncharacterized protein n=1 Tax=Ficus carica TaxID=3494 RepID=A0AA87ZSQ4_FICCA|nr:hypothetical protein TIFTF001_008246 [Ficus carica]